MNKLLEGDYEKKEKIIQDSQQEIEKIETVEEVVEVCKDEIKGEIENYKVTESKKKLKKR